MAALKTEKEIISNWKNNRSKPLVSICLATFNQEKFVENALKGFLIQETSFPFEILINDDCSNDTTPLIIKKFETNYPNIIKTQYQKTNQMSQGINVFGDILFPIAKGKYIAMCEGDDYWIEPKKLQWQSDFLEQNPDYGLVHGDINIFNYENKLWEYGVNKNFKNSNLNLSKKDLFHHIVNSKYRIRTSTVFFRKNLLEKCKINYRTINILLGDTPLWLDFSQATKFKYIEKVLSVYQVSSNSISRPLDKIQKYRFDLIMLETRVYYLKKYNYEISGKIMSKYNEALLTYKLFNPQYIEKFKLFEATPFQRFKLKNISYKSFYVFFYMQWLFSSYIKRIIKKISKK